MIRCLVVDDEPLARQQMVRLLAAATDCEVVGEAAHAVEALELMEACKPDVVFLDIEMPGMNAFDMLADVEHPPVVVFATAYDEFALRAFDANAVDYLLKPIQPERFALALAKVRAFLNGGRDVYESSLKRVLSALRPRMPAKIAAHRGRRIVLLSPRDILLIRVEDQMVFLHTRAERFVTSRTIGELEEALLPGGFVRVSRSAVVNLEHARELSPGSSGTWTLRLSNDIEVAVSRERARTLKARIG